MLAFVLLFFVAILALFYSFWRRNTKCEGVLPPGSMGLPFIGETLQLIIPSYSLDMHPFFKKRIKRYGPIFRSNLACQPMVISADPEFNSHIITQEGKLVELWYLNTFSKMFKLEGESRTNIAGTIHKFIRKSLLSRLGIESLKEKWLPHIENMVKETLHSWSTQNVVDVKRAVSSTICDFTYKLLCDIDYDGKGSDDKLSESFTIFSESLLAFPLNIPGTRYHTCLKNKEKAMNILRKRMMEKRRSPVEKKGEDEDFLDLAFKEMERDKYFTDDFIMNLLFATLFASFDSMSTTTILMLNFLSSHPSVLQQLIAEHESILQNRRPDCSISWEEYKSMTYTHQVINETLRMTNTLPGLLRKVIKDIQFKGYTIPAGWTIMLLVFDRHLNPEVYKDPLEFNPSRWKDLDSRTISKNFTPFGGGIRQCVGAEYTRVTMAIFFHVLVTKYRWTHIKEAKAVRFPVLGFGKGLHIKLFEKH